MTSNMPSSVDLSFLRNRAVQKRIAVVTLACATAGVLYGLLVPKWYRSVLTVVPAKSQRGTSGLAGLLAGESAGLAAGFMDGALGAGSDGPRIAAVLQSIAVTDAVIEKFDLRKRYDKKYQESAREELWHHCEVKVLPKPSLVQLSCEDKDPRFVQEMLSYFADYGNRVFRRVGVSSASEEVRFLLGRVAELRQLADDAAARMQEFQEQHKIVDLDTQAKAVVSTLAALNSQRITKQLELEYARTFSARDEASMRQLRSQLSVMGERLRDLEEPSPVMAQPVEEQPAEKSGRRGSEQGKSMFPPALEVPKLRAEFESLYRDRKVAEATLIFALERLEGAKANEARDVSTFLVLDPPTLPTRKSRPRRLYILTVFTMLGFVASVAMEWWSSTGGAAALFAQLRLAPRRGEDSQPGGQQRGG
jgi:tyrosine-protein kinase Etk/Wzc